MTRTAWRPCAHARLSRPSARPAPNVPAAATAPLCPQAPTARGAGPPTTPTSPPATSPSPRATRSASPRGAAWASTATARQERGPGLRVGVQRPPAPCQASKCVLAASVGLLLLHLPLPTMSTSDSPRRVPSNHPCLLITPNPVCSSPPSPLMNAGWQGCEVRRRLGVPGQVWPLRVPRSVGCWQLPPPWLASTRSASEALPGRTCWGGASSPAGKAPLVVTPLQPCSTSLCTLPPPCVLPRHHCPS